MAKKTSAKSRTAGTSKTPTARKTSGARKTAGVGSSATARKTGGSRKAAGTRKTATARKAAGARKTSGARKTGTKRKGAAKRELIDTGTDKRYVRRNPGGRFKESDDVGRSLSADARKKAKTKARPGQGDKGDR